MTLNPSKVFSKILIEQLAKLKLFRKIAGFLNLYLSPSTDFLVEVKENKMYARSLDRILALYLWKFSLLEDNETQILKKLIKKGMSVFDIGANIGYYTLIFSRLVGKNGRVFSFEPDPENFRLLVKNIKVNKFKNITPVQKAVSNKNGKIILYLCQEHKGNHSIIENFAWKKIMVESTTLDSFLRTGIKPDLIKMDIEGAEYLALLGMKKTLTKNKKIILLTELSSSVPKQLFNLFKSFGLKVNLIDKDRISEPVSPNKLIRLAQSKNYLNLLLAKS